MTDDKAPQYEAVLKNQERILINQKQIKQGQRQLSTQQDKLDVEVIANQQTILNTQVEMETTLKEIRFHQKQLKSNQDRLDVFFSTLETVIANQDKRDFYFGGLDERRVLFNEGRDFDLSPKQEGPRINLSIGAYVEIDGKPYDGWSRSLKFTEVKQAPVG